LNTKLERLTWHTEERKVKELLACPYNPRKVSEEQKQELIKSLQKFNLAEIPAINTDNTILAGHQRIAVLLALGRGGEVIDVRVPNRKLRKEEADEYMVRSNRNVGEWDFEGLAKNFNFEFLKETGFNDFELDKIFERGCKEDGDEDLFNAEEEYDKIGEPKTKRGDIYILGEHRVMCGSSRSREDFERLMDGKKGRLIFTDPPYNVDYKSPAGLTYSSKKFGGTGGKIFNDNLSDKDCLAFYTETLRNLNKNTTDDATIYWWFANKNNHINRMAFEEAAWKMSQIIIWVKNSMVLARGQDYHRVYEPCMVGWKKKQVHYKDKNITNLQDVILLDKETFAEQLDVWYEKRDNTVNYVHPTQKPVRLAERALKRNSKSGDIVIDAFGGSGSTLIACEQLGRKCFCMELDPNYVEVIVKRWEEYSGKRAELKRG
jgi:DNA modification methylase